MASTNIPNVVTKTIKTPNWPKFVYNRNPRSLEKICIAYKPDGWHLEKPGRSFWHKLFIERSPRAVTAYVKHYTGHIPVQASTKEWAIRKHLYSAIDGSAYLNLARIFSLRCIQCGITEMCSDLQPSEVKSDDNITNLEHFVNELHQNGLVLKEPMRYINPRPSDLQRPDKPWLYF